MSKGKTPNELRLRNSTVEFLTFAYQTSGDGVEVRVQDGKNYKVKHYNLDAIIAVGYRVNSKRATAFRQWATAVLRDYTLRGYVMDKKRMENGAFLDDDYFERLLEEIREIRLSERRFYQKIADIYATAMDYAVHGHTAAALIYERVDAEKTHMGLTTWANSPDGKIVKGDVSVAKNYLTETELDDLGRIVGAYLDLAEGRAKRKIPMTMEDWAKRLDVFLSADERKALRDAGRITAKIAKAHIESEFEKYRVIQDRLFRSDFDLFVELTEHATDGRKGEAGDEG
jgi:hypothetical protein